MKKVLVLLVASLLLVLGCTSRADENKKHITNNISIEEQKSAENKQAVEKTKTKQSNKQTIDNSSELSQDLYSFQIELDGRVYNIPTKFSNVENNGWVISDESKYQRLKSFEYTVGTEVIKDDADILVEFINFTSNELPIEGCSIGGIIVSADDSNQEVDFSLPGGIRLGSLKEEVIAAYGDATNEVYNEETTELEYLVDTNMEIKITIDNEQNNVCSIKVENFSIENSKGEATSRTLNKMPDDMPKYQQPAELSNDILSFNIEFGGALYNIPAPVNEFIKNGWVIQKAAKDTAQSKEMILNGAVLRKGNTTFTANIYNPSFKETAVKNCYIISIEVDIDDGDLDILLPRNITLGSTKDEVLESYSDVEGFVEDSVSYTVYNYQKRINQYVYLVVDKETELVTKIAIENAF